MISKSEIKLIRGLKAKKQRDKLNLFVAEGTKLVEHFIDNGMVVKHIFYLDHYSGKLKNENQVISSSEMKQITLLDSESPILAVLEKPHFKIELKGNVILALDDVRDPGNMGTIIRLADWFGVKVIVCSPNCVDIFNSKVVQSTMGSLVNVQIITDVLANVFTKAKADGYVVVGAEMAGTPLGDFNKPEKLMLVMGNEANGINAINKQALDVSITIPRAETSLAESLNVAMAAAILLGNVSKS